MGFFYLSAIVNNAVVNMGVHGCAALFYYTVFINTEKAYTVCVQKVKLHYKERHSTILNNWDMTFCVYE